MAFVQKNDISFEIFLAIWNASQGLKTPVVHFKIAHWLQVSWDSGDRHLLLMAFRGCGKSTIAGLFVAWLLYHNPNLRFLILAAETSLARKMTRNVKNIIERHILTFGMKPDNADQWASDRFTVRRENELRDPSLSAHGITANITGSRADIVICDDVEVPNTSDTADKREVMRERLREIDFILTPNGVQFYLGTPHTFYSIYKDEKTGREHEEKPFLQGFKRLEVPVFNAAGESAWPERFSNTAIDAQRKKAGPNAFASQMMLRPVNVANGRLDVGLLRHYDDALVYREVQLEAQLSLGSRKIVSASAWWDPAFGSAKGDRSVLAVVYTDEGGDYWLHHMAYIKNNADDEHDEATQQCRMVAKLAAQFYLPSIAVETNGIGKFLPAILRRELSTARVACSVLEKVSSIAKDKRILQAFDAPMAARALHVHNGVLKTPFIDEMREWRPENTRGHDDGLDAAAGALSLEPVRIKRHFPNKFLKNWRASTTHARTEFDV